MCKFGVQVGVAVCIFVEIAFCVCVGLPAEYNLSVARRAVDEVPPKAAPSAGSSGALRASHTSLGFLRVEE